MRSLVFKISSFEDSCNLAPDVSEISWMVAPERPIINPEAADGTSNFPDIRLSPSSDVSSNWMLGAILFQINPWQAKT